MNRRDLLIGTTGLAVMLPLGLLANRASASSLGKVLAVISHPVEDFAAWKAVYDSVEALRQKAEVTGAEVFQEPGEPNKVVVIHRFPSIDAAESFLGAPELKAAMMKGGVTAPPTVILAVVA